MAAAGTSAPPSGARLLASDLVHVVDDVRIGLMVADHAWETSVERLFGIPREEQSSLVKLLLTGAVVSAAAASVPRPKPLHLTRADTMMGGSVAVVAAGGLAGATAAAAPVAGAVIGVALAGHAVRSVAISSSRRARVMTHGLHERYRRAASAVSPPGR